MQKITKLLSKKVTPEKFARQKGIVKDLTSTISLPGHAKAPRKYEAEVFNFLFENRQALGIKTVQVFKNLLVDGAIVLDDNRRLAIEIKLRMNWTKACQAEWEFRNFLLNKNKSSKHQNVSGGIVIFEEFSGDWCRRTATKKLENGWNHWYHGHNLVEGLRLDLFRLQGNKLESFRSAFDAATIQQHMNTSH